HVLRAIEFDARADEVAGMIGGHGTAVQNVIRYLGGCHAVVKFLTNCMSGLDRVFGRYVVGDALRLQRYQELVVVGVGVADASAQQRCHDAATDDRRSDDVLLHVECSRFGCVVMIDDASNDRKLTAITSIYTETISVVIRLT